MNTTNEIVHEGFVRQVRNGVALISFQQSAGCSGCSARSGCGLADSNDKVVEIPIDGKVVREGEQVLVRISGRNGYKAVLISYFVPFLLVVAVLIGSIHVGLAEPLAGVVSLSSLIPYYGLLKLLSSHFKNEVSFEAQKR